MTNKSVDNARIKECPQAEPILDAFMHFCYDFTDKNLIVFDVRTIEIRTGEFLLTEPIVFSKDTNRYGSSNLDSSGIKLLMSKHDCNEICHKLSLNNCNYRPEIHEHKRNKENACSIS